MKLGLYGGSFDPVHLGHLLVAQAALEELQLDRIVFVPAAQSPFKPEIRPATDATRLRMLRMALAGCARFEVETLEIDRGGVSYTIDTVREILKRRASARLSWLIGADHVAKLPLWRESGALAELAEFVVIPRPGEAPAPTPPGFSIQYLRGWPLSISSSEIRRRARMKLTIHHLVPPGIAELIEAERLYKD